MRQGPNNLAFVPRLTCVLVTGLLLLGPWGKTDPQHSHLG